MARLLERLLIIAVAALGLVYGERVLHTTLAVIARVDPAHIHGLIVSGSALGFVQAGLATLGILFGVVPVIGSLFDRHRAPTALIVGELVAALLLLGASQHLLRQSVHANIVGAGSSRVLALSASTPVEAVE